MNAVVYRHFDKNGRLLYVGSSMALFARILSHMHRAAEETPVAFAEWLVELARRCKVPS